jgi:hypothetical protein
MWATSQQMTVMVEFDRYEIALAAYESADYGRWLRLVRVRRGTFGSLRAFGAFSC